MKGIRCMNIPAVTAIPAQDVKTGAGKSFEMLITNIKCFIAVNKLI